MMAAAEAEATPPTGAGTGRRRGTPPSPSPPSPSSSPSSSSSSSPSSPTSHPGRNGRNLNRPVRAAVVASVLASLLSILWSTPGLVVPGGRPIPTNPHHHGPVVAVATVVTTKTKTQTHTPPNTTAFNIAAYPDPTSLRRGVRAYLQGRAPPGPPCPVDARHVWDLLEGYSPPVAPRHDHDNHDNDHSSHSSHYYSHYSRDVLSPEVVCGVGPGRGIEQDAGYKLLVDKIRVGKAAAAEEEEVAPMAGPPRRRRRKKPRLLCLVYTHSPMRHLARSQAVTWGHKCDGFLAFSNETVPEWGVYELPHPGYGVNDDDDGGPAQESYRNMWQKVRAIWRYVHDHHSGGAGRGSGTQQQSQQQQQQQHRDDDDDSTSHHSYDYYLLSGDDVYVLVDNLRRYLEELWLVDRRNGGDDDDDDDDAYHDHDHDRNNNYDVPPNNSTDGSTPSKPHRRHFGLWLPGREMVAGGPGYVLNRAALRDYVGGGGGGERTTTTTTWETCNANVRASAEDRLLSRCLSSQLGVWGNATDTRDPRTGEQRFHDANPATLYTTEAAAGGRRGSYHARMAAAWEGQPPPPGIGATATARGRTGPRRGLDAAAKYSISLHDVYSPLYMARLHSILHPDACPPDSPLGRGLAMHRSD